MDMHSSALHTCWIADFKGSMSTSYVAAATTRTADAAMHSVARPRVPLQYEGNHFDGAVLPGRPTPPSGLDLTGAHAMRCAIETPATPAESRERCDVLLFISSAAGYERRRKVVRQTYLTALAAGSEMARRVRYRFLLGAPKPDQVEALAAEQAEYGDLLQVTVPESYETLFPKVIAAWRWAVATHEFGFWMHADDDSYIRLDLLLRWLASPVPAVCVGVRLPDRVRSRRIARRQLAHLHLLSGDRHAKELY